MKRYLLIFICSVMLVNYQANYIFAASAGVPVPAPAPSPPTGDTTKYAVGAAVASFLYYTAMETVETTKEFYDTVGLAYDALAPKAKEALSQALQVTEGATLMYGTEALEALRTVASSVNATTVVKNGVTFSDLNASAVPSLFYEKVSDQRSYFSRYPNRFHGDAITSHSIGTGVLYVYSYTWGEYFSGQLEYGVAVSVYVRSDGRQTAEWVPQTNIVSQQAAIALAVSYAVDRYGENSFPVVHEYPKQLEKGVRVPSISAGSVAGSIPYFPSVNQGRVAVPAIPDKVVHTYPDGAKDVAFIPVNPGVEPGTWVGPDGKPVTGKPIGIPVPMDPSIPWNPAKPTYRVPDGTVVTTPDGAITIPGQIDWDTPITKNPDIPVDPSIPPVDVPESKPGELDFRPLLMAGEKFTKKFPFSIPWDLARQLSVFDVTPKAPKIAIDYSFSIGGTTMHPNWSLSLEWLDPLAAWIRWILTIAMDIAFILLLRRLMPE